MKALFPGSFDPFTIGHLSIVERGLGLFDSIVVAVGVNYAKQDAASVERRLAQVRRAVAPLGDRVEVTAYEGLTVDAVARYGAGCILRGVRTVADYEYERTLADVNRRIASVETVLLFALPEMASISSSVVRELRHYGRDTSWMVPGENVPDEDRK